MLPEIRTICLNKNLNGSTVLCWNIC